MKVKKGINHIQAMSSLILARELQSRGVEIQHLNPYTAGDAFLHLAYGDHIEQVYGTRSSNSSSAADYICKDKYVAKAYLAQGGLEVADGKVFSCSDFKTIGDYASQIGFPCVLKKYNGSRGDLVFVGVDSRVRIRTVLEKYFAKERFVLVEKQFSGEEYRFFATRSEVIGIASREPANIVGDGVHSVTELVAIKNGKRREKFKIKLSEQVEEFLETRGISFGSVVDAGEKVYLRHNSNLSTGGDSVDRTDECHPDYKDLAIRAIRAIPGLAYGGVDIMIRGAISLPASRSSYIVLEVNSNPGIFIHHFPYEGKGRDVAGAIVDILFPETKKKHQD